DFDFFSGRALDKGEIARRMSFVSHARIIQDEPNAFTVLAPSPAAPDSFVKVSFFGSLRIGRIGAPDETHDRILLVASPEDLLATKLKVMLQRVEAKDYMDIATLISAGVSLARAL